MAIHVKRRDSPKNCSAICFFSAPTVFRKPTSLARRKEYAVVRFIKFMQAMARMKTAMMEKK